jgi:hypothetical protein
MKRAFLLAVVLAGLAARPLGASVSRDNFLAKTARDVVVLCPGTDDDPMHHAAIGTGC